MEPVPSTRSVEGSSTRWSTLGRELLADVETPVSAYLKLGALGARFLLESVDRGTVLGRYSFLGLAPILEIECHLDRSLCRTPDGLSFEVAVDQDPTRLVEEVLRQLDPVRDRGPGNLLGGAVGYLGYEYVRSVERVPVRTEEGAPVLGRFLVPSALVTFDHLSRRMTVRVLRPSRVGEPCQAEDPVVRIAAQALDHVARSLAGKSPEEAIEAILAALDQPAKSAPVIAERPFQPQAFPEPEEFQERVRRAQESIRAGDIFQVVLSQSLRGPCDVPPFQLYRALRMLNPSPYLFFLDFGETHLVGSSPEVLVKLEDDVATVRPIAGTRPRGRDSRSDRALAEELLADEKERAEHVMLVDLGRNDLGRVCTPGSVQVTDFMTLERYSHVMHIVSWVQGTLRPDQDRFDLLRATFPAGTVSGAPKIRAMQIIHELEDRARGPYSGAVGYLGPSSEMDLCIAIRTMVCHRGELVLQAGAGIVADSSPLGEHLECRRKMEALLAAVRFAERGLR